VLEEGKQTYYAINFQRGEKLSEKSYDTALARMKEVHDNCVEIDTSRAMRIVKDSSTDVVPDPEVAPQEDVSDYPKDDINPDDIPF